MTLAQQNGITEFPYIIKDEKGRIIYFENADGYWYKSEYNSRGNETYCKNSLGYWRKREYDEKENLIYFEDSFGDIIDKRPKKVNHTKVQLTI
jgi:hypothetical protein